MTARSPSFERLALERPPHLHSGLSPGHLNRALLFAAAPPVAAGLILFGRLAAAVLFFSVLGAALGEVIVYHVAPRGARRDLGHALLIGVLLALTLPVTIAWHIAFLGGLIALCVGKGLLGGLGNYVWHPALVGRAALQLLYGAHLAPRVWPVLASDKLWSGSIRALADTATYRGYQWSTPSVGADAWALQRPVDQLAGHYGSQLPSGEVGGPGWVELFRDHLPPWRDTLWGTVGGGIGETCTIALVLSGLYLIYRGLLRWQSFTAALLTVVALAAVLPVRLGGELVWLPGFTTQGQFFAGLAPVLFHLTGGGLLLSCLLLFADPLTTPLTARGHAVFGVGVGVITMAARYVGFTPGSCYWAVLVMNTLVPLIDRRTRRLS